MARGKNKGKPPSANGYDKKKVDTPKPKKKKSG
jgi:hypothetical protein